MQRTAVSLLALAAALGGCDDPVRDRAIAELGPEDPAVPVGPLHRPGQACVLCHRAGGEAEAYSVAGTIYRDPKSEIPVPGTRVLLVDSVLRRFEATTNCAGNFFVTPEEFAPRFPLWVTLRLGDHEIEMESAVYHEGSCAACHTHPPSPSSAGRVFLFDEPPTPAPEGCPTEGR